MRYKSMRMASTLGIVMGFVALPLLLPLALAGGLLRQRRLRAVARTQCCPICGAALGLASVRAGDQHWTAQLTELRRRFPDGRFRFARLVDAICPVCGVHLRFDEANRALVPNKTTAHPL